MEMSVTWSWNLGPFWSESLCAENTKETPPSTFVPKKRELYNVTELASTSMILKLQTKLLPPTFKRSWFATKGFFCLSGFEQLPLIDSTLYFTGMHEVFKEMLSKFSRFYFCYFDSPQGRGLGQGIGKQREAWSFTKEKSKALKTSRDA